LFLFHDKLNRALLTVTDKYAKRFLLFRMICGDGVKPNRRWWSTFDTDQPLYDACL